MFPLLIAGLLFLVGLLLLGNWFLQADPARVARILKGAWLKGFLIALVAFVVFLLAMRGGMLTLLAFFAFFLPMLFRLPALMRRIGSMRGPAPGQTSEVTTRFLRLTLDHDSGEIRGIVLEGPHRGRNLEDLPIDAVLELLAECRVSDPQSVSLLEAFLDRSHGEDWRAREHAGPSGGDAARAGGMTRAEAHDVLGVKQGATQEQIRRAHRRLMRENHPDRGGSTEAAARINQAKDVLLG